MKDGKLKTRPSLLENLIFFVEVRHLCFVHSHDLYLIRYVWTVTHLFHFVQTVCIVLWMASHCAKILRPLKTSLQKKKKKKKKDASTALVLFFLISSLCPTTHMGSSAGNSYSVQHCLTWSVLCAVMVTLHWWSVSVAASGSVWVPGADGELAGPDYTGFGAYKGARDWHDGP